MRSLMMIAAPRSSFDWFCAAAVAWRSFSSFVRRSSSSFAAWCSSSFFVVCVEGARRSLIQRGHDVQLLLLRDGASKATSLVCFATATVRMSAARTSARPSVLRGRVWGGRENVQAMAA